MNFKNWIINEEIYQNNTATIFHRTPTISAIFSLLTTKFNIGKRINYGSGLYTTTTIDGQFVEDMKEFGAFVTKWKVQDLDKYIVLGKQHAIKIHGDQYIISSQLEKLNALEEFKEKNKEEWEIKLKQWDKYQEVNSPQIIDFLNDNEKWLDKSKSFKGCIYRDNRYGYCLLKFNPIEDGTITFLAYAEAEADDIQKMEKLKDKNSEHWIKSTEKASIKSIYRSPQDQKTKYGIEIPELKITPTGGETLTVKESPFVYHLLMTPLKTGVKWDFNTQKAIGSKDSDKSVIDPVFIFSYENKTWNLKFKKENFNSGGYLGNSMYEIPNIDGTPVKEINKIKNNSKLCFNGKKVSNVCFQFNFEEKNKIVKGESDKLKLISSENNKKYIVDKRDEFGQRNLTDLLPMSVKFYASSQFRLEKIQTNWIITQIVGAKNTTNLNGIPLEPSEIKPLKDGDIISIGKTQQGKLQVKL